MAFELPGAVYSPELLESVIYELEQYTNWYRETKIHQRVGAKPIPEPAHSAETALVIETWMKSKTPTLEALEELEAHLRGLNIPEVHVMLAALPTRAQREVIVEWFRNNITPNFLLSFVADRNIGGGLVVRTPNQVFDLTWSQQLITQREKLAGIIKRV